jgi:UDPglucose--hexose-1-phosphate uridylyltransferase
MLRKGISLLLKYRVGKRLRQSEEAVLEQFSLQLSQERIRNMSELRQDPTTREWVIIAPERAKRPQNMPKRELTEILPEWEESCPFCPTNENRTPPEILRFPLHSKDSDWSVRVVPNLFSALTPDGSLLKVEKGYFFRKRAGVGAHEVIIDTPSHNAVMALMTYKHIEEVLSAYQQRYNTLKQKREIKFIMIFKNHGWASGTSLIHPHSQLIATPVIATYYNRKFDVAHEYYVDNARCIYCDLLIEELDRAERIVTETKNFIVFHPYASHVPYETWIMPKEHCASFGLLASIHLTELATVLKDSLLCLYKGLNDPDFNLMIDTATTEDEEDPYYHWHIRIMPRLTNIAGFEMGSGIRINTVLPEETANNMKHIVKSYNKEEWLSFKHME